VTGDPPHGGCLDVAGGLKAIALAIAELKTSKGWPSGWLCPHPHGAS
jgi:hypothetical protein